MLCEAEPHAPVPSPGSIPLTLSPPGRGSRSSAATRYAGPAFAGAFGPA
jgi:hypothetical protein